MTCNLCSNVALRIVDKRGYCLAHTREAFEDAAQNAKYTSSGSYSYLFDKNERQWEAQREHARESGYEAS